MAKKDLTHGMSGSRPYVIWCNMRARCDKPTADFYHMYGARGISYDPSWTSFEAFWEDMHTEYADDLSLERLDNDKGYNKDNCCWVPLSNQARNRRKATNNTSGSTGVSWKRNRIGVLYACARWSEGGKDTCRYFSVKKYGAHVAYQMACKCRDEAIERMRQSGVAYGKDHGK